MSLAVLGFALPVPARAGPLYVFQNIGTDTHAQSVNSSDQVGGYYGTVVSQGFSFRLPSNFVTLNFPGAAQTQIYTIGDVERVVGSYVDQGGTTHGFLRSREGVFSTSDAPGTAFTQLRSLNTPGQSAGFSSTDPTGATQQRAFIRFADGSFGYLDGLLPAGTQDSVATRINNKGVISGYYVESGGVTHGFLGNFSQLSTFDVPGSTFTEVLGENNFGQSVGVYKDASGASHGFLLSSDFGGPTLLTIDNPLGVGTTTLTGINDRGDLVGYYVDLGGHTQGFLALHVIFPEPTGLTLACVCLGGLGLRAWRSRRGA
jgi:hypothetical protein